MEYFYLQNQSYHGQVLGIVIRSTDSRHLLLVCYREEHHGLGNLSLNLSLGLLLEFSFPDKSSLHDATLTGRGGEREGREKEENKGTKTKQPRLRWSTQLLEGCPLPAGQT